MAARRSRPDLTEACLGRFPVELVNLYGPTEATIDATWWCCRRGESSVPIGRPIAGTRAWVLDEGQRPVPPGVPGELYLGGVSLARGYLNRPDLTAERFVPDPRRPESGARLYRTGDRARWRDDGALEYLGRIDHQIKLRGMRIELGEVEAALAEHPAVREAVAAVRDAAPGDPRLYAWVVPEAHARLDRELLRHFLAEQLPDPMIPRAIVALDALPLTPSGKVDRAALPAPGDADLLRAAAREPPATPLETALAALWSELLGITDIGRRDDFFVIGGHSLLAARLVARLRERLGVEVTLRQVFETPALADLAEALREQQVPDDGITIAPPPAAAAPTLRRLIEARARRTPEAPAITAPGTAPLSYRDLLAQADEVLAVLATWGLGRGDRIALVLPQGPDLAVAFVALVLGATAVPLNPAYRAAELERYLESAGARAVIVPADGGAAARAAAAALDLPVLDLTTRPGPAGRFALGPRLSVAEAPPVPPEPEDVAFVIHTSGTTARPKVIPLSHANLSAAVLGFIDTFRLVPEDRALGVMPLFHVQGLMVVLTSLVAGASVSCTPAFDPTAVFAWMDEARPTWYSSVPTIHQAVVAEAPAHAEIVARHCLRFIRSSAAPLAPAVMADLERIFAVPVIEGYGQSESCMHVSANPLPPGARKPGSVGRPVTAEVVVVDDEGRARPVGEAGEIQVRGATVMTGYENDPAANGRRSATAGIARAISAGSTPTATSSSPGASRSSSIAAARRSPREVDDALVEHPAIARAVTFPVPHPTLGEDVAAALVLRPGATVTDAEIRRFVGARLAPFKAPRRIVIVDAIPLGRHRQARAPAPGRGARTDGAGDPAAAPESAPLDTHRHRGSGGKDRSEVLGRAVGPEDDFIELGGDSLRATVATARVAAGARRGAAPRRVLRHAHRGGGSRAPRAPARRAGRRERGALDGWCGGPPSRRRADAGGAHAARGAPARRGAGRAVRAAAAGPPRARSPLPAPAAAVVPPPPRAGHPGLPRSRRRAPRRPPRRRGVAPEPRSSGPSPRGPSHHVRPRGGRAVPARRRPGAVRSARRRPRGCDGCGDRARGRRRGDDALRPRARAAAARAAAAAGPPTSTCSSSPCTTSSPTAGRWASWPASSRRCTAPIAPAGRSRCRRCPSSTATTRSGSAERLAEPRWRRSSRTGAARWPARRAAELPTDRPRPALQSFAGTRVGSRWPPSSPRAARAGPPARARRCT